MNGKKGWAHRTIKVYIGRPACDGATHVRGYPAAVSCAVCEMQITVYMQKYGLKVFVTPSFFIFLFT